MRRGRRRRLPAGRVSTARPPGGAGRRADQHATRSPGDSAQVCEANGRDLGRAAAAGSAKPQFLRLAGSAPERRGRGERGEEGGDRRAGARLRGGGAPGNGR